jgi:hypothetical protein
MSKTLSIIFLFPVFLLISSASAGQAAIPDRPAAPETYVPDTQFWRTGFTINHIPSYLNLTMRNPAPAATFSSNAGEQDIYFVLGVAARLLRLEELKIYLLSRSGSYSGSATINVQASVMGGAVDHTLSSASLNVQTIPTGAWRDISLTSNPADLRLSSGQALVVHFHLDGAPGGNLQVSAIFQAAMTRSAYEIYLPEIVR